jgi:hypothetical protein
MARYKRGARSQAVRDYLAANPTASPKEVVEGLREQGVKVKVTLVNSIKYKKPSGKRRGRRAMTISAAARRAPANGNVTFDQLLGVKWLVDSLGGADQVRQALDALAQLQ